GGGGVRGGGVGGVRGWGEGAGGKGTEVPVELGHAGTLDSLDLGGGDAEPLRELGERHVDRHVVAQPADGDSQNCLSTRRSGDQSGRISSMSYRSCADRSRPQPNAKPLHSSGSTPTFSKTRGSTMPAPPSSIQPLNLHVRQPTPPQTPQDTSGSIDGSVNGKKCVRNRTRRSSPKSTRITWRSVPLRSESVIPRSTARPSNW